MDNTIGVVEKIFNKITPKHLTFTMFITMFLNLFSLYLYFFNFDLYKFSSEYIKIVDKIWTFNIVKCFLLFVLAFNIFGWIISTLNNKRVIKVDIGNMYQLIGSLYRGFGLYLSIYVLYWSMQRNAGVLIQANSDFTTSLVLLLCSGIMLVNFFNILHLFLYDDETAKINFDVILKKEKYMNNTINKYKSAPIEDLRKRVLFLDILEKTSVLYDKGIKVDESYFEEQEQWNQLMREYARSSEDLSERIKN